MVVLTKNFYVTQRSDGRGGIRPFGNYSKGQAGAEVKIGEQIYKVTTDGRVNIPKSIMEKYGVGEPGKKSIGISFSAARKTEGGWRNVSAVVYTPEQPGETGRRHDHGFYRIRKN